MNFFVEFKRRNLIHTAVLYVGAVGFPMPDEVARVDRAPQGGEARHE
jgi:D-ribose pyranose/furanose isomerase RbsD